MAFMLGIREDGISWTDSQNANICQVNEGKYQESEKPNKKILILSSFSLSNCPNVLSNAHLNAWGVNNLDLYLPMYFHIEWWPNVIYAFN